MENYDVVIIGAGISGLIAANELGCDGNYRILIIDKGISYKDRLNQCNADHLSGQGGAGTIGGGKLCYPPASGVLWEKTKNEFLDEYKNVVCRYLKTFANMHFCYYNTDQLLENGIYQKKYDSELISADNMHKFINSLIENAESMGVETRLCCEVQRIEARPDGCVIGYQNNKTDEIKEIYASHVVYAGGRSGATDIPSLLRGCCIKNQLPDLGVRIQFPRHYVQEAFPVGQDIKLKSWDNDILIRTFCVCAGGQLAKVNLQGATYYDGHFGESVSDTVNLGILARSPRIVGISSALEFIRKYQNFVDAPIPVEQFITGYRKIAATPEHCEIFAALSSFLGAIRHTLLMGVPEEKIELYIPSVDHLNPVVETSKEFITNVPSVSVIGDASGVSRGFIQALWSGHCASVGVRKRLSSTSDEAIS